jgi:hypothetical protein
MEISVNYWTYTSSEGVFSIIERSSRGVDVYFGHNPAGHYRSPVEAAEEIAKGNHPPLACAPHDGKSLGVPSAVHNWQFVRASRNDRADGSRGGPSSFRS